MITDRLLGEEDFPVIAKSLAADEFHQGTTPEFFTQPGTITKVYQIDEQPVMYVRGAKSLRLDIQFVSNSDHERNKQVMLEEFPKFAQLAKENGFSELVFCTTSRALRVFCKKMFKFREVEGELRKII